MLPRASGQATGPNVALTAGSGGRRDALTEAAAPPRDMALLATFEPQSPAKAAAAALEAEKRSAAAAVVQRAWRGAKRAAGQRDAAPHARAVPLTEEQRAIHTRLQRVRAAKRAREERAALALAAEVEQRERRAAAVVAAHAAERAAAVRARARIFAERRARVRKHLVSLPPLPILRHNIVDGDAGGDGRGGAPPHQGRIPRTQAHGDGRGSRAAPGGARSQLPRLAAGAAPAFVGSPPAKDAAERVIRTRPHASGGTATAGLSAAGVAPTASTVTAAAAGAGVASATQAINALLSEEAAAAVASQAAAERTVPIKEDEAHHESARLKRYSAWAHHAHHAFRHNLLARRASLARDGRRVRRASAVMEAGADAHGTLLALGGIRDPALRSTSMLHPAASVLSLPPLAPLPSGMLSPLADEAVAKLVGAPYERNPKLRLAWLVAKGSFMAQDALGAPPAHDAVVGTGDHAPQTDAPW
jgi:hypothetical protein